MLRVLNAHSLQGGLVQSDQRSTGDLMLQKVLAVQVKVLVTVTLQPLHHIVIVPEEDRLWPLCLVSRVGVNVLLVHFLVRTALFNETIDLKALHGSAKHT